MSLFKRGGWSYCNYSTRHLCFDTRERAIFVFAFAHTRGLDEETGAWKLPHALVFNEAEAVLFLQREARTRRRGHCYYVSTGVVVWWDKRSERRVARATERYKARFPLLVDPVVEGAFDALPL